MIWLRSNQIVQNAAWCHGTTISPTKHEALRSRIKQTNRSKKVSEKSSMQ